jgi:hypothetical protein
MKAEHLASDVFSIGRGGPNLTNVPGATDCNRGPPVHVLFGPRRARMSAAGRARIAAAQRLRWAKVKGKKVAANPTPKRRRMSANVIARIRAAQKTRWAKWRKEQKKR